MHIIDVPLILDDKDIVRENKQSWAWMANQYGFIFVPTFARKECLNTYFHWSETEYAGKQEQRYHLHTHCADPDRHYQSEKHNPIKYMGIRCGLAMHAPLNFHDDPMWMYNS